MKWVLVLVGVLALGTVWLLYRAQTNEARFEAATPPSGQMIDVDGHPVHVEISGNGPPIVLIHGASGNLRDMTFDFAPALARDFTTIAFDRPGLGYTPALNENGDTLKEQADLLAAAVRKLGYDKVYVLGQSYGGSVALSWALEHPHMVAGLVLVSAPSNVWPGGLGWIYRLNITPVIGPVFRLLVAAFPPWGLVDKSLEGIFSPQPVAPGFADHVGTGLTLRRATQKANAYQIAALKDELRAMVPRYADIMMPVEAIHGSADTVVPEKIHTDKLAHQIPDINVKVLTGVGHMPHHTNLSDVIAAVKRLHARVGLKPAP